MRAGRVTAAAGGLAALALAGCMPVPTVLGRTAAVLPEGKFRESFGGGFVAFDASGGAQLPDDASEGGDVIMPYGHASYAFGLGRDLEFSGGLTNGQGFIVFRWQPVGVADTYASASSFPLDISVEVGASIWGAAVVAPVIPFMDAHVGVNASLPGRTVTPYLSCRRHAVRYSYWNDTRGIYDSTRFGQWMFFLGVEFRGAPFGRDRRMAVEAFYGRSDDMDPAPDGLAAEVWGVNVVVGRIKW
ncbi:MAG: hypothetical protein ACYS9X_13080 [Planctomycetota bacterium]|jgi:hypothetical protein